MLLSEVHGHTVYEAKDGPAGVECALRERPDVAFIDLGLPGFDGYEVARRIRAGLGANTIRLVALTGYGGADDHRRTREAGFDMHLVKPIDAAQLGSVFARVQPRKSADDTASSAA
jgi:CheY-like chemotaxis protein